MDICRFFIILLKALVRYAQIASQIECLKKYARFLLF